jgi:hypothetical protein
MLEHYEEKGREVSITGLGTNVLGSARKLSLPPFQSIVSVSTLSLERCGAMLVTQDMTSDTMTMKNRSKKR